MRIMKNLYIYKKNYNKLINSYIVIIYTENIIIHLFIIFKNIIIIKT